MTATDSKQAIRERIWTLLEQSGASPPGAHGRIPDFHGADTAAARLAQLPQWQTARPGDWFVDSARSSPFQ